MSRSRCRRRCGYYKIEDIEACEKAGLTPHVPRPQRGPAVREGFSARKFRYDAEHDAYICPAGQVLATRYESKLRELVNRLHQSPGVPRLRVAPEMLHAKSPRKVSRLENEAVLDRMETRLTAPREYSGAPPRDR